MLRHKLYSLKTKQKEISMKPTLISATFLLLATSSLSIPASAEDVPPVVTAIFKSWEAVNVTPIYDKLETDSNGNVTITNLSATIPPKDGGPEVKFTVGEIALNDVGEEKDGIISVGSVNVKNTKLEVTRESGVPFTVEMPAGAAEELYIPAATDDPTPQQAFRSGFGMAKHASSSQIKASAMGQTITSDGYESTWEGDPTTGAGKFDLKISNIVVPEALVADADPSGQMKQLGYGDLTFNVAGNADIRVLDDKFGFTSNVEYSGKDIGGLKMILVADDVPMAALAELKKAQKESRQPDMTALMPQLMNVSFGQFKLRFEDASITKKLLPVIAKMQGMDEATMVANAGAVVQLGLMQLKSQAFTDQVVGAVNAFLKDPKSITVAMKPAQPVAVQNLMTLNPADPAAAITKLGVSVTAND
jgi:hypothetical protein